MTVEQYRRAREIELEISEIRDKWRLFNNPTVRITNSEGSPCDRNKALERLQKEFQEQINKLENEFKEL